MLPWTIGIGVVVVVSLAVAWLIRKGRVGERLRARLPSSAVVAAPSPASPKQEADSIGSQLREITIGRASCRDSV